MRQHMDPEEKRARALICYHQAGADYYGEHGQPKMQKWATDEVARWQEKLGAIQGKRKEQR